MNNFGKIGSVLCVIGAIVLTVVFVPKMSWLPRSAYGPVLHEETSDFSKIRIRGDEKNRHMMFVAEDGREGLQSSIDLTKPGEFQVAYARALFSSFLMGHAADRVLIIGLGGGGMVHFLSEKIPGMTIDVVEIDPAVVRLAKEYFAIEETDKIHIHTADAFEFVKNGGIGEQYDAIYLDAFLRPSVDNDPDGKTARLKTVAFLNSMKTLLKDDGVLACNLIRYRKTTSSDIASLEEAFPTVKQMGVSGTGNLVILASSATEGVSREKMIATGEKLEKELPIGIPFAAFARRLE